MNKSIGLICLNAGTYSENFKAPYDVYRELRE
jgi:hypothetical protein